MATTNAQLIEAAQMMLYAEGKLRATSNGIEPIHTYAAWKSAGYQVRRGEKAIAKFAIWKYAERKKKDSESAAANSDGEEKPKARMFLKESAFFAASQVDKIPLAASV